MLLLLLLLSSRHPVDEAVAPVVAVVDVVRRGLLEEGEGVLDGEVALNAHGHGHVDRTCKEDKTNVIIEHMLYLKSSVCKGKYYMTIIPVQPLLQTR